MGRDGTGPYVRHAQLGTEGGGGGGGGAQTDIGNDLAAHVKARDTAQIPSTRSPPAARRTFPDITSDNDREQAQRRTSISAPEKPYCSRHPETGPTLVRH